MALDVTDASFQVDVIERSHQVPVIVDLWAPWCGPCQTLGPILERTVDATAGEVVLAKVNVDENPQISAAFQVQSIPAVFIIKDGRVVGNFVGAKPEHEIQQIVMALMPNPTMQRVRELMNQGSEEALRDAVALAPGNEDAICSLAECLVKKGEAEEALSLLARLPETDRVRHIAATARLAMNPVDNFDEELSSLLDRVKSDDGARQEFLDILETMGPNDPRTAKYRKLLSQRLF